jgi:hypothetical protein
MLERLRAAGFDVEARNHAGAILQGDFATELAALTGTLLGFRLSAREIIASGGGQAAPTLRLRDALYAAGWGKHVFRVATMVDGRERIATSHEIDHVRRCAAGTLALEIEWNNKDPFFDRDLENFQRLHAQGAISVGVLVTRGSRLQAELAAIVADALDRAGLRDAAALRGWGVKARTERQDTALRVAMARGEGFAGAFARSFVADKFGAATTHWAKLSERVRRGVGNPCPMLLLGLPLSAVAGYSAASPEL